MEKLQKDSAYEQIKNSQKELYKLREKGENKISDINAKIALTKKSKKLTKEQKAVELEKYQKELLAAKQVKEANQGEVKALIAKGRTLAGEYYLPKYKEKKETVKTESAGIKVKYKEDLSSMTASQVSELKAVMDSNLDENSKKDEVKRLKIIQKNQRSELKLEVKEKLQNLKNEKHNLYLDYVGSLKNITSDRLNIKEKFLSSVENYSYNFNLKEFLMKNGLYIIIILFMIFCIISNPRLISISAITNILKNFSTKVFFALGVAGLILLGGTDLSVGRMVTLGSLITCMMLNPNSATTFFGVSLSGIYNAIGFVPTVLLAILFSTLVCVIFSAIAGFFTAKFKIHPFITTLGTSLVIWGIAGYGTQNIKTGAITDEASKLAANIFRFGSFPGIPLTLIYSIIAIAVVWFIWNKTKFGKNMYAVGGNQEAASVSGISVFWVTLGVFIMAGILYGVGSFLIGVQTGSSSSTLGQGWELEAIAACVVGGISFSGGIGKVRGAVIGCLLFEILKYYLRDITGGSADITNIFIGIIIIVAVVFDSIKYLKKK